MTNQGVRPKTIQKKKREKIRPRELVQVAEYKRKRHTKVGHIISSKILVTSIYADIDINQKFQKTNKRKLYNSVIQKRNRE